MNKRSSVLDMDMEPQCEETPNIMVVIDEDPIEQVPQTKKRGRKPKGGKIITKPLVKDDSPPPITNVILHLKCSMQDLTEHNTKLTQLVSDPMTYNPTVPPSIMAYDSNGAHFSLYTKEGETHPPVSPPLAYKDAVLSETAHQTLCKACNEKVETIEQTPEEDDTTITVKDINTKLKKLKVQLYKGTNTDKKAACFWCTYDYDNPPCYIPKYEIDGHLHGYGSFCRPECAVAFLMEENIDDSTKFERYHLLNQMYSKVYDYKKNIKPAPNPYYLLDKFYGNLSIQEYRKLLKTEHMLLVIDKPMTRILPELHEDTEDFVTNIYGGKTAQVSQKGVYKVKRQSEKQQGPSKSSIMKESFGF